jgi:hypothetical protein
MQLFRNTKRWHYESHFFQKHNEQNFHFFIEIFHSIMFATYLFEIVGYIKKYQAYELNIFKFSVGGATYQTT